MEKISGIWFKQSKRKRLHIITGVSILGLFICMGVDSLILGWLLVALLVITLFLYVLDYL
ncbi:MAG: hypothetical protein KO464_07930 [Candidatus Methanofastidiosum sp.]|nr:hypothetical protein [Methanofastidiosum sp.]